MLFGITMLRLFVIQCQALVLQYQAFWYNNVKSFGIRMACHDYTLELSLLYRLLFFKTQDQNNKRNLSL